MRHHLVKWLQSGMHILQGKVGWMPANLSISLPNAKSWKSLFLFTLGRTASCSASLCLSNY
jgi:hypothetical protein